MSKLIEDTNSTEWLRVRDYCKRRLGELRRENDGFLDPPETDHIRGMIAFAKEVLSLASDEQIIEINDESYYG